MLRTLALCLITVILPIVPAAAQNIGGENTVEGRAFNGSPYGGFARITVTSETTCRIEWRIGRSTYTGICMRNANTFSAAYTSGKTFGLLIYHLDQDGAMEGIWTVADQPGSGRERLTPVR